MTIPVMLDTGPLGMIAHPRRNLEIADWLYNFRPPEL